MQVVRFEEVVWPNIRSALTHDQDLDQGFRVWGLGFRLCKSFFFCMLSGCSFVRFNGAYYMGICFGARPAINRLMDTT